MAFLDLLTEFDAALDWDAEADPVLADHLPSPVPLRDDGSPVPRPDR
jgi:hypothetical protein